MPISDVAWATGLFENVNVNTGPGSDVRTGITPRAKRGWGREGVRSEARAEQRLAPGGPQAPITRITLGAETPAI